ncbi:MAG: TolC family protein [Nitrospinales bacterium]
MRLSLRNAIEKTLQNNVDIKVQEQFPLISDQDIIREQSVFDPLISAETSAEQRQTQVSSSFASPNVNRTDRQRFEVKLNQKLLAGTNYEFRFDTQKSSTNSRFTGLNPQYFSEMEFTLTQPLLRNFGFDINKTQITIANNNRGISDFDFQGKVIDILARTENFYWDLVFSHEDLKVKQKSLERARDLEKRVKAQVDVGTMAPIEILQAQSEVASREQLLLTARNLIQDTEDKLKNIMNVSFDSPEGQKPVVPIDRPLFSGQEKMLLAEAIKTALANRPDYLAKKKDLENKNIRVRFNKNQTYPSLDLFGSLGLNGLAGNARSIQNFDGTVSRSPFDGELSKSLGSLGNPDFFNWKVGIKLSYPLGNRAAKSRLTAARLEAQQALLDLKNIEKNIVIEVREALRQIKTDIKRVQAARLARKLAREKLSAEEKKFAVGLSTSFNVLEFQEDLAKEQSNEIKAVIDYKQSKINLNRVMATTLERHHITLSSEQAS